MVSSVCNLDTHKQAKGQDGTGKPEFWGTQSWGDWEASWKKKSLNSHLREDPDTKEGKTQSKHKNNIPSALLMREQSSERIRDVKQFL